MSEKSLAANLTATQSTLQLNSMMLKFVVAKLNSLDQACSTAKSPYFIVVASLISR